MTTLVLQRNDFSLSDLFGCIQIIELKLNEFIDSAAEKYTMLPDKLKEFLLQRKSKLLENPLMLCALFLDPRYKCNIDTDPEKLMFVKITLENLWQRMKTVNGVEDQPENLILTTDISSEDDMSKYYVELDAHYGAMGIQNSFVDLRLVNSHSVDVLRDKSDIAIAIVHYERQISGVRVKSSESIHTFWETNKKEFGTELYELACVIFAIPPTQSSVERNFSALRYMFTDHRWNLAEDLLESLLIIHLNPNYFLTAKELELEKLAKSKTENN